MQVSKTASETVERRKDTTIVIQAIFITEGTKSGEKNHNR